VQPCARPRPGQCWPATLSTVTGAGTDSSRPTPRRGTELTRAGPDRQAASSLFAARSPQPPALASATPKALCNETEHNTYQKGPA